MALTTTTLQIIPAERWYALVVEPDEQGKYREQTRPVACWALVDREGSELAERAIVGMVAKPTLVNVEDDAGFVGYTTDPNMPPEELRLRAFHLANQLQRTKS